MASSCQGSSKICFLLTSIWVLMSNDLLTAFEVSSFFISVISIYAGMSSTALKVLTISCCAVGLFCLFYLLYSMSDGWFFCLYYLLDLSDYLLEYLMLYKKGTSLYQLFGNYFFSYKFDCKMVACVLNLS